MKEDFDISVDKIELVPTAEGSGSKMTTSLTISGVCDVVSFTTAEEELVTERCSIA